MFNVSFHKTRFQGSIHLSLYYHPSIKFNCFFHTFYNLLKSLCSAVISCAFKNSQNAR